MSISHRYTDFGDTAFEDEDAEKIGDERLEEIKLGAFEKGYKAGWDDATKAYADGREKQVAETAQTLQDMSFTYHEAYGKLSLAMQPLVSKIVTSLLPKVARETLGAHIRAELETLLKSQADGALEIAVHPGFGAALETALQGHVPTPFAIREDGSLTAGQAIVRVGRAERAIDLDALQTEISEAVTAFFDQPSKETPNG